MEEWGGIFEYISPEMAREISRKSTPGMARVNRADDAVGESFGEH